MLLKKLVVGEDEDAVFHLIQATLGDAGYLCLRAHDAEETLVRVRTEMPDVVVIDRIMPGLDGLEVVRRIKSDVILSRIPVLVLTARGSVEERIEGLEAGADDYVAKPFHVRELAARIKALVRQSRRERHRNPTTGLPSGEAIDEYVSGLIARKTPFALCYVDLEGWEAYADAHGFRRYEDVVGRLGKALLDATTSVGEPKPFVGHVGGDDFVVVCEPGAVQKLCGEACERFEALASSLGATLRLSITVVRTDETAVEDLDALSMRLADLKRKSRT